MGAALTQAPELLRAVVAEVGVFDMLRVELTPNGVFNVADEYPEMKQAQRVASPPEREEEFAQS